MKRFYFLTTLIVLNISIQSFAMDNSLKPFSNSKNETPSYYFTDDITIGCLNCLMITNDICALSSKKSFLPGVQKIASLIAESPQLNVFSEKGVSSSAQKVAALVMEGKKTYAPYNESSTKQKID